MGDKHPSSPSNLDSSSSKTIHQEKGSGLERSLRPFNKITGSKTLPFGQSWLIYRKSLLKSLQKSGNPTFRRQLKLQYEVGRLRQQKLRNIFGQSINHVSERRALEEEEEVEVQPE